MRRREAVEARNMAIATHIRAAFGFVITTASPSR
ncbi:hypothetical protein GGR16_003447 [Chelatococcus caeni]|uniref:Uncharacterized protein n=1 Tax=Chelatococcus caeni TaxID=1348468 RepID=A0A840BZN1_9HYPH|nr:hypothetical protein [Chelatococcus caeni]